MNKYTLYEAVAIAAETGQRIKRDYDASLWNTFYKSDFHVSLKTSNGETWWPSVQDSKKKNWIIEPEKIKDVFVWGIRQCGGNVLLKSEPRKFNGGWLDSNCVCGYYLDCSQSFPKDKPQKFKLVQVDNDGD